MTFQEIEDRLCAKYEKGNTRAEFVCEMFYSLVPNLAEPAPVAHVLQNSHSEFFQARVFF